MMAGYMFTILQTTDITPCAKKEKILVSLKLRTPPISCHKRKEYYPEIIYNKQKNVYPTKSRHQELAAYEHCSVSQANKYRRNSKRTCKFLLGWRGKIWKQWLFGGGGWRWSHKARGAWGRLPPYNCWWGTSWLAAATLLFPEAPGKAVREK